MRVCVFCLLCPNSNGPKDVQGCPAAPEEFYPTAFLVLLLLLFPMCALQCFALQHGTKVSWHGADQVQTRLLLTAASCFDLC